MEFSFCSTHCVLFFISLISVAFRTNGNPRVSNEIQLGLLQKELKEVIDETDKLKKGNDVLIKEINLTEISCNETLSKLEGSQYSLFTLLLKKNKTLGLLMQRLLEEDVEHGKLESKLKELYLDLDTSGVKYHNDYQELIDLESRRQNATDLHCATIMKKLEEPKSITNKNELKTRSKMSWLTKLGGHNFKEIEFQNRLSLARVEEKRVKSQHDILIMKKENNKQMCNTIESDLKKQIAFIEGILKSFEDNVEILNSNIKTSIFLTESLKVEIQFGEKLLSSMKDNILKFNQVEEIFQRDKHCYVTIKGTV